MARPVGARRSSKGRCSDDGAESSWQRRSRWRLQAQSVRGQEPPASPSASAYLDPVAGLGLDDAIARALANEPGVRAARLAVDVTRGEREQSALRANPSSTFELRARARRNRQPAVGRRAMAPGAVPSAGADPDRRAAGDRCAADGGRPGATARRRCADPVWPGGGRHPRSRCGRTARGDRRRGSSNSRRARADEGRRAATRGGSPRRSNFGGCRPSETSRWAAPIAPCWR